MTLKPAASVTVWTAREMSPIVFPTLACSIPASSAALQVSSRRCASGEIDPTGERPGRVGDEAVQRHADVDREDVAVRRAWTAPGMPCTTMAFGDRQVAAG